MYIINRNAIYQLIFKLIVLEFTLITLKITFTSKSALNLSKSHVAIQFRKSDSNDFIKCGKINSNKLLVNSTFNHVHIAMGFNEKYVLLSSVTIASILYNANINTYLHIHIITLGKFTIELMEKINSLRYKINNNVEFFFYDGSKIEKDFPRGKHEIRGYGDYSRLLITEVIYDINRVILLDSADIIVQKDLLELYQYNIGDAYAAGVLDRPAGCRNCYKYFRQQKYINTGVLVINRIDIWRKKKFYRKSVEIAKNEKDKFECPSQDIINTVIPKNKTFLLPLKYNVPHFFYNKTEKMTNTSKFFIDYLRQQNYSKYKYSIEEIIRADNDPIIRHHYNEKVFYSKRCNQKIREQWKKYAKMTGFYEDICKSYPNGCF